MILQCVCASPYQDSVYGKGMRVHNKTKKETQRCTVCLREKGTPSAPAKSKKS